MNRSTHVWLKARSAGRGLFVIVMACCIVMFVTIGVVSWLGKDRPVYWGTFTAASTTCDPFGARHCTTRGTWISDDAQITKSDVLLDGSLRGAQTVRASYQPGGPMGDDSNNVVHTAAWTNAGLWFPGLAAVVFAALLAGYTRKWRRADRAALAR